MSAFLEMLKAWGPLGAFIVGLVDSIGLPNPGGPDYLLLYLAWTRPETAYVSAAAALVGALTGSTTLFWVARRGGQKYLDKKASGPRAMKFRQWFQRYGLVTVFIPSVVPMIPLPMKVFVICAGAFGVNPVAFVATMAVGKIPRFFGLTYLGIQLGEHSTQWLKDHRWHFALAAVGLAVFLYLLVKLTDIYRSRNQAAMVANHE